MHPGGGQEHMHEKRKPQVVGDGKKKGPGRSGDNTSSNWGWQKGLPAEQVGVPRAGNGHGQLVTEEIRKAEL